VIKSRPNICNYLDMPLQHASTSVLKAMRRGITGEKTVSLLNDIRERVPGIAMRTTLIVGFPGETEADFEELKNWVRAMRFERLGVFTYSHEENTHAHQLEDDVPEKVKKARAEEILAIQSEISLELNEERIGKVYKVLFDRAEGGYFVGRTEFDSPEVDNEVLVPQEGNYVRIGDFCDVRITSASHYDLFGEPVSAQ